MRHTESPVSWVVYQMNMRNNSPRRNAVCAQNEWDALELAQPGFHTLVQAGIPSEAEAEKLARGTSGDPTPRRRG